jgi:DNA-binding CsgD family transcriptional regulator
MHDSPSFLTQEEWVATSEALRLSDRERQIVARTIEGESEGEIAQRLGISPHTVHTHLERLYRKLRVSNRPHLVGRVLEAYARILRHKSAAPRSSVADSADG